MIASRVTHQRSSIGSPVLFSRREILRAGGSGLMGLSLGGLLEADVKMRATGPAPQADACIIIFLNGGPSHLDM